MTQDKLQSDDKYNYQLLGRLKMDCDYFLGFGNRNPLRLWANNIEEQIAEMKKLYNSFHETKKPQWLTWEEILNYESLMGSEM